MEGFIFKTNRKGKTIGGRDVVVNGLFGNIYDGRG
jgi:hypothetical protein